MMCKNFRTLCAWGHATNHFFDPEKSRDGGGYWQFSGGIFVKLPHGAQVVIEADDASCGWFGSCKSVTFLIGSRAFPLSWGTMDGGSKAPTCKSLRPLCSAARISYGTARELIREAFRAADLVAWNEHKKSHPKLCDLYGVSPF